MWIRWIRIRNTGISKPRWSPKGKHFVLGNKFIYNFGGKNKKQGQGRGRAGQGRGGGRVASRFVC
jgi:hypothetical protein